MVVDYDGRILAQADPGPGEKIVVAPIDIAALRAERERRQGHHMLAHLRTEAYANLRRPIYPSARGKRLTVEDSNRAIDVGKRQLRQNK
jgi:hypothetical protein